MMKTRLPIKKLSTALLLGATAFGIVIPVQATFAQSSTESKMELMTAALRARSQGNLEQAKRSLEELIRIAPNDAEVQRLLSEVNEDIARQEAGQSPVLAGSPTPATTTRGSGSNNFATVDALVASEAADSQDAISAANAALEEGKTLAKAEAYGPARQRVEAVLAGFPVNRDTQRIKQKLDDFRGDMILEQAKFAANRGDYPAARGYLAEYEAAYGSDRDLRRATDIVGQREYNPARVDIEEVSPGFVENEASIRRQITRGRAQFAAGDYEGARVTFGRIEAESPNNAEAKYFLSEISKRLGSAAQWDRQKTRNEMLESTTRQWQLPRQYDREAVSPDVQLTGLLERMREIRLPRVNFNGLPLSRVADTLASLSEQYDPERQGVNIVVMDPTGTDPNINLRLNDLTLDRVLDFVVQSINYQYDIEDDAIVIRPGAGGAGGVGLETEFFSFPRGVRIRILGAGDEGRSGGGASADPFAAAPAPAAAGGSRSEDVERLKTFFEGAGIPFQSVPGADLVIADGQLIVTNNRRNVEKVQNILRRYSEFRQVEIESKFLEVAQGDLEEIGFNWGIQSISSPGDFSMTTGNRSLAGAFTIDQGSSAITIVGPGAGDPIPFGSPQIPSALQLGAGVDDLVDVTGRIGGTSVNAMIRALSQKSGSDLLVAPRVTVLSGKTAEIVVAQELLYPERYSEIQSTASTSSGTTGGGGGSSISITAGTPEDFVMRNVGVEMSVTPTVEDDRSISLLLEPIVTEFDGFVEYGGPSVAISGDFTVTVPAGFFQPIFSVRRVRTEVTIWDGATVVMGGLTRDEVRTVRDKVPVLGDMPIFGRLFRSEGETSQKRNLMIFVTANLISPGGSPSNQTFQGVDPGALFQNPQIVTPGGAVSRRTEGGETE